MYALLAILGPSIIGLKLLDYFKKGLNIKNIIYYYLSLLVLSSACTNIIVYYLLETKKDLFDLLSNSTFFFGQYTLINTLVNIILVLIIYVFIKNVSFDIIVKEVDTGDRKNKKEKTPKQRFNKIKEVLPKKHQKNS